MCLTTCLRVSTSSPVQPPPLPAQSCLLQILPWASYFLVQWQSKKISGGLGEAYGCPVRLSSAISKMGLMFTGCTRSCSPLSAAASPTLLFFRTPDPVAMASALVKGLDLVCIV